MHNATAINHVADLIENHILAEQFTMTRYGNPKDEWDEEIKDFCRTPACIAGWTLYACNPAEFSKRTTELVNTREYSRFVAQEFRIREGQANALTMPLQYDTSRDWCDITREQAVLVLRNLARTGEVDWKAAIRGDVLGAPEYKPVDLEETFGICADTSSPADSTCAADE